MQKILFLIIFMTYTTQAKEISLFNGMDLTNWEETPFSLSGKSSVQGSKLVIERGDACSGVRWTGEPLPVMNYEISLDVMRISGNDFFCGLTFPINSTYLTLILGGWGGSVVGLSCIDGFDAANNETGTFKQFSNNRWYSLKLRVAKNLVEGWINGIKLVHCDISKRELSLREEVMETTPLGLTTWKTTGAFKNLTLNVMEDN